MGGNSAVIGGHVCRGSRYPELVGTYLAADHSGVLWAMPEKVGDPESFDVKFLRPLCAVDSLQCTATSSALVKMETMISTIAQARASIVW